MTNEPPATVEVVPPSALEAIHRGEIDVQIRTAHQFPRSMQTFKRRAVDMATIDEETAESCIYVRPVGKKDGKMQYAEGLSVRMAEIVGASYGNLRVGSMIVDQTDRYVITRGFAHDLETNFASTSETKEPTVTRDGHPMSESMRAVIAKAALAKARRDATFQVVPKALCRPIENAARQLIAGDAKSLTARKDAAVQYIQRLNIDAARVWAALGIEGPDDITSETLMTLTGLRNAIKDKDTTIDEAFPDIGIKTTKPTFVSPPETKGGDATSSSESSTQTTRDEPNPDPESATQPADDKPLTPLLALSQKLEASKVKKEILVKYLIENKFMEPAEKLEKLPAARLTKIVESFDSFASELDKTF